MVGRKFAVVFLSIFLLVLITFFVIFSIYSHKVVEDGAGTMLWAALTILVLLFGVIGISLFLNRNEKKPL